MYSNMRIVNRPVRNYIPSHQYLGLGDDATGSQYLTPGTTYQATFSLTGITGLMDSSVLSAIKPYLIAGINVTGYNSSNYIGTVTFVPVSPYVDQSWIAQNVTNALNNAFTIIGITTGSASFISIVQTSGAIGTAISSLFSPIGEALGNYQWPILGLAAIALIFVIRK